MQQLLIIRTLLIPFIGCLVLFFVNEEKWVKFVRLCTRLITFVISLLLLLRINEDRIWNFVTEVSYIGVSFTLGLDGIRVLLVVLTTFLITTCVLCRWTVPKRIKEFIILFLLIEGFLIIVFITIDIILFYIFFESVLIPIYILVGVWGRREKRFEAAFQLFLYTLLGRVLILLAILAIVREVGRRNILVLQAYEFSVEKQLLFFLAFFASFAIKVPMVPFHLWLPKAHVEAPTAGRIILAGVLLKLGGYGFLRFSLTLFPDASTFFSPFIFLISLLAIVYASLTTLQQTDLKRIIAYSRVAHIGVCTLGFFSETICGIEGAIFLILSHGFVSGALFLCIGIIYDRFHVREIRIFHGLTSLIPLFAVYFFIFTIANLALPASSSFVGEFMVLLAIFQVNSYVGFFATTGVILRAAYSLWLFNRIIFGQPIATTKPDLNRREFAQTLPLAIITLVFGIYPSFLITFLHVPVSGILYSFI